jgi:hypothetical protein
MGKQLLNESVVIEEALEQRSGVNRGEEHSGLGLKPPEGFPQGSAPFLDPATG